MTATPATVRAYRVVGMTDDVTTCGLCERTDLQKTVAMRSLDAEGNDMEQEYFGTDCATKVAGWTQRQLKDRLTAAKAAERAAFEAERAERDRQDDEEFAAWAEAKHGVKVNRDTHTLRGATFDALATLRPRRSPFTYVQEHSADRAAATPA